MVTHNMKDAIRMGNRLIMMHGGRYDVSGEEKKTLKADLLKIEVSRATNLPMTECCYRKQTSKADSKMGQLFLPKNCNWALATWWYNPSNIIFVKELKWKGWKMFLKFFRQVPPHL